MSNRIPRTTATAPPKRLAACIGVALCLAAPLASATTWTVNSCFDTNVGNPVSHTGTLRFVAQNAVTLDTIDLSTLACSTITLTNGAIALIQENITLNGPSNGNLLITGKDPVNGVEADRIFTHTGTGLLHVSDMSIMYGYLVNASPTGSANGGCIVSTAGSIQLDNVTVAACQAIAYDAVAGGMFAYVDLTLNNSTISGNAAIASNVAVGGGVTAGHAMTLNHSSIIGNSATGLGNGAEGGGAVTTTFSASYSTIANNTASGLIAIGGGIIASGGGATILYSTVSDNIADGPTGYAGAIVSAGTATIRNSTISGNHAGGPVGGILVSGATQSVENSTIVFNSSGKGRKAAAPYAYYASGLLFSASGSDVNVTMQGNLIANNTYDAPTTGENDLGTYATSVHSVTFIGSSNLILQTQQTITGLTTTIAGVCPLLGPLRDNGGSTWTHALLSGSPGIDQDAHPPLVIDQRGSPRPSGLFADIGAYEVQQLEVVFNTSFEGCP